MQPFPPLYLPCQGTLHQAHSEAGILHQSFSTRAADLCSTLRWHPWKSTDLPPPGRDHSYPPPRGPSGSSLLLQPTSTHSGGPEYGRPRGNSRSMSPPIRGTAYGAGPLPGGYREPRGHATSPTQTSPRNYHPSHELPGDPYRSRSRMKDDRGKERERGRDHTARESYAAASSGARYPFDATRDSPSDSARGELRRSSRERSPWTHRRHSSNTLPALETRDSPVPMDQPSRRYDPIYSERTPFASTRSGSRQIY